MSYFVSEDMDFDDFERVHIILCDFFTKLEVERYELADEEPCYRTPEYKEALLKFCEEASKTIELIKKEAEAI